MRVKTGEYSGKPSLHNAKSLAQHSATGGFASLLLTTYIPDHVPAQCSI